MYAHSVNDIQQPMLQILSLELVITYNCTHAYCKAISKSYVYMKQLNEVVMTDHVH